MERQGNLEIGNFAGDMSLYLAALFDPPLAVAQPSLLPSITAAEDGGGWPETGAPFIDAFAWLNSTAMIEGGGEG